MYEKGSSYFNKMQYQHQQQYQHHQSDAHLHTITDTNYGNNHVSKSLSLSRITGKNYKRNLLATERLKSISNEFLNSAVNFVNENTPTIEYNNNNEHTPKADTYQNDDDRLTLSSITDGEIPCFGITKLDGNDLRLVRDYLTKVFKNQYHPLGILNAKISNCFYTSYGCWKVKPISILSAHAMRDWESLSKRIYDIVRKMFPTLPQDYGNLEE